MIENQPVAVEEPKAAPIATETTLQTPVQAVEAPVEAPKETPDLMSRVTSFMDDNKPTDQVVDKDFHFDVNEIDKIEDPQAKEFIRNAYKSLEKGYQQKFQTLAELRKGIEGTNEGEWTVEKVQTLINDPKFVQAAQQVAGQQPVEGTDEYSALSETEKSRISNLENELTQLRKQNMDNQNLQQHDQLSSKYANYDKTAIDTLKADLIAGKVRATNEHLYKVVSHDDNVRRAYDMGRQDERSGNVDRSESLSVEGQQTVSTPEAFQKAEGESSKSHWRRIAASVLKGRNENQQIRK